MKTGLLVTSAFAVALLGAAPAVYAGQITIDDFTTAQALTAPIGTVSSSAAGGGILGGERDAILSIVTDTNPFNDAEVNIGFGIVSHSNPSNVNSTLELQYDGVDGSSALDTGGLGNLDLGGFTGIAIDILSLDLPVDIEITVYTDGVGASTAMLNLAGGIAGQTFVVPFAAFVGAGDFGDVGAITFDFSGTTSFDLTLDLIQAVPEPAPLALMGAGLLALGLMRKSAVRKS